MNMVVLCFRYSSIPAYFDHNQLTGLDEGEAVESEDLNYHFEAVSLLPTYSKPAPHLFHTATF